MDLPIEYCMFVWSNSQNFYVVYPSMSPKILQSYPNEYLSVAARLHQVISTSFHCFLEQVLVPLWTEQKIEAVGSQYELINIVQPPAWNFHKVCAGRNQQEIGAVISHTWMQRLKRGDISFFRLSRIKPKIFSKEAVSCCLNSMAGYRASICDMLVCCPKALKGDRNVYKNVRKLILDRHDICFIRRVTICILQKPQGPLLALVTCSEQNSGFSSGDY